MKLDIEKAAIKRTVEHGFNKLLGRYFRFGFENGANYALEQLSKSDGFREFWIPHMMIACETLADAECADPEMLDEITHVIDIQALAAANAKNAALELELRKAKVESEVLKKQMIKFIEKYLRKTPVGHSLDSTFESQRLRAAEIIKEAIGVELSYVDAEIEAAKAKV